VGIVTAVRKFGQRLLVALGRNVLLAAKDVRLRPVITHVEVGALGHRELPPRHHLDGFVVFAPGHLERDGPVLRIIALCHDLLIAFEERKALFDGRAGLLVQLIQFL